MAFLLSLEGVHRRDLDTGAKDTGAKVFAALGQPVLIHGARPTRDQVHSSGPWDDRPLEWSTMPVSSRGPGGVGPGDATRLSSTPSTRTPAKTGRAIRCGSQTRLDMGPHGIPRSYQLSSQASDGSSFEAQLSDRPADRPGPQTHPGGAHPLVMFQERWPGLVLWTGCFEGCWLLLVVLCPLARVLVG